MMVTNGTALRAVGVGVRFGAQWALADVQLECAAGDFVAIVGPSGCGKSTLLRVLARLQRPVIGRVHFDVPPPPGTAGVDTRDIRTSYVFQEPALLPWRSVLANIGLPLELQGVSKAAVQAAAQSARQLVGLHESDESKLPGMLSGGMRMRTSLARAVVTHPSLMLFDEPLAAVDDVLREQLLDQLQQLWLAEQWTAVFVTHNVDEAAFISRRVLVMKRHPGTLTREVPVPFAYPRRAELRDSPEFAAVTGEIRRALREAAA